MKKTIAIALVLVTLLSVTVLPFTASAGGLYYPVEDPIQYNSDEYLVSVASSGSAENGQKDYYLYDKTGRLIRKFASGTWGNYPISDTVFSYDEAGRIVGETVKYFYDSAVSELKYNYGSDGRLISVKEIGSDYDRKYEYDAMGKLIAISESNDGMSTKTVYSYDSRGRLTEATYDAESIEPISFKYAYRSDGRLSTVQFFTYIYNCSYDFNGNLRSTGGFMTYKYVAKADLSKFRFVDVPDTFEFYDAVEWAAENGVTNGTSANTFSPFNECTRAQVMTFLWRAMGCPKPKTSETPFTDVKKGSYYYDAVLWACENGITKGVSKTSFAPDRKITVPEALTFVWRAKGSPIVEDTDAFIRISKSEYYYEAVRWATYAKVSDLSEMPEKYYPALRYNVAEYLWAAFGREPALSVEYRNNLYETFGKVNILPQAARWDNGDLVIDCCIVNGFDTAVKNIVVTYFYFGNDDGKIVRVNREIPISGEIIAPHTYIESNIRFKGKDILATNADLGTIYYYICYECDH